MTIPKTDEQRARDRQVCAELEQEIAGVEAAVDEARGEGCDHASTDAVGAQLRRARDALL